MEKSFTVCDMPLAERPRERLALLGATALSAQELLAILLGRGGPGQSVMTLANNLLKKFGSLEGVCQASLENLQTVKGLGLAKATQLKSALEIARRLSDAEEADHVKANKRPSIAAPEDIFRIAKQQICSLHKEQLILISFDNRNRVIGADTVAVGTLNASLVHPREIFDLAINRHAASIALSHNHPSGDPQPSAADLVTTKRLIEAGKIMGIELIDHVIITSRTFFSFRENNLLQEG